MSLYEFAWTNWISDLFAVPATAFYFLWTFYSSSVSRFLYKTIASGLIHAVNMKFGTVSLLFPCTTSYWLAKFLFFFQIELFKILSRYSYVGPFWHQWAGTIVSKWVWFFIDFVLVYSDLSHCFNCTWSTKEVYCQTQHFCATQQCATCFGSSEQTSGIFIQKFRKCKSICNIQINFCNISVWNCFDEPKHVVHCCMANSVVSDGTFSLYFNLYWCQYRIPERCSPPLRDRMWHFPCTGILKWNS